MIKRKASSSALCAMKAQDGNNCSTNSRKKSKSSSTATVMKPAVAPAFELLTSNDSARRNKQSHGGHSRKHQRQQQSGGGSVNGGPGGHLIGPPMLSNAPNQQQQQDQPVWIYGLINNIEQMLSQFNNKQRLQQVAHQQQQQQQQAQQQQHHHRNLTVANNYGANTAQASKSAAKSRSSAHSSGYSTPSSLYSSASLSPPISTSSLNSCAYSSSSSSNSPISASSQTLTTQKGINHAATSTSDFNNGDLSSTTSTTTSSSPLPSCLPAAINQQQQQLPRSPISRQIKFHEYKGPPQAKRPTKTQQQQQPQVNSAPTPTMTTSTTITTAPNRFITTATTKETNGRIGGQAFLKPIETRHNISSSSPDCIVLSQVAPTLSLQPNIQLQSQSHGVNLGQQQALGQTDGQQPVLVVASSDHLATGQQQQVIKPMRASAIGGPEGQFPTGSAQVINNFVTHPNAQSSSTSQTYHEARAQQQQQQQHHQQHVVIGDPLMLRPNETMPSNNKQQQAAFTCRSQPVTFGLNNTDQQQQQPTTTTTIIQVPVGCQLVQQHRPFGIQQQQQQQQPVSVQVIHAAQQNVPPVGQQISYQNLHPQQNQQQQQHMLVIDPATFQKMQMQHNQPRMMASPSNQSTQGPMLMIQGDQAIKYSTNTNDKSNSNAGNASTNNSFMHQQAQLQPTMAQDKQKFDMMPVENYQFVTYTDCDETRDNQDQGEQYYFTASRQMGTTSQLDTSYNVVDQRDELSSKGAISNYHNSVQPSEVGSYSANQTASIDYDADYDLNASYDNIEPTISFQSDLSTPNGSQMNGAAGGGGGHSFDDTLLFSEFIDLQDIPLNVDESDWLKKFLPPCSSI